MLPQVHIAGNLVEDPTLRFTPSGAAICSFRIAAGERRKNAATGEWEDGDTTFLSITTWRQVAENCAESLAKGDAVIVSGRLKQRTVEGKDGTKTTYYDLDADEVGASLKRATAKLTRMTRTTNTNSSNTTSNWNDDPWATQPAQSDGVPF